MATGAHSQFNGPHDDKAALGGSPTGGDCIKGGVGRACRALQGEQEAVRVHHYLPKSEQGRDFERAKVQN